MLKREASQSAADYFEAGFHCAESVAQAIVALHEGELEGREVQRYAAGFQGGIGGTQADICGALAGGIVAIGCLRGRREASQDNQEVKALCTAFRRRFVAEFGSSNCGAILEGLNERGDGSDCLQLTAKAAGLLEEVLAEKGD